MQISFKQVAFIVLGLAQVQQTLAQSPDNNRIVIIGLRDAYIPFNHSIQPVFTLVNDYLNVSVTDRNGDILEINRIPISKIKKGVLYKPHFQTILISSKNGTFIDKTVTGTKHLLEVVKTDGTEPGTAITIGIKTTVSYKGKSYRIYATLSGSIPSPQYIKTN
jgi:hypothetical protein